MHITEQELAQLIKIVVLALICVVLFYIHSERKKKQNAKKFNTFISILDVATYIATDAFPELHGMSLLAKSKILNAAFEGHISIKGRRPNTTKVKTLSREYWQYADINLDSNNPCTYCRDGQIIEGFESYANLEITLLEMEKAWPSASLYKKAKIFLFFKALEWQFRISRLQHKLHALWFRYASITTIAQKIIHNKMTMLYVVLKNLGTKN